MFSSFCIIFYTNHTSSDRGTQPLLWPYGGAVGLATTRDDDGTRTFALSSSRSQTGCVGAGNKLFKNIINLIGVVVFLWFLLIYVHHNLTFIMSSDFYIKIALF